MAETYKRPAGEDGVLSSLSSGSPPPGSAPGCSTFACPAANGLCGLSAQPEPAERLPAGTDENLGSSPIVVGNNNFIAHCNSLLHCCASEIQDPSIQRSLESWSACNHRLQFWSSSRYVGKSRRKSPVNQQVFFNILFFRSQ